MRAEAILYIAIFCWTALLAEGWNQRWDWKQHPTPLHHHNASTTPPSDGDWNRHPSTPVHNTTISEQPDWRNEDHNGTREKVADQNETIVEISGGLVKGVVSYLGGRNKPAHVFRGIPIAEPPVGKLRFRKLLHRQSWRPAIFNATKYSPACPSNTSRSTSPQKNMDEDCLYINVFADASCRRRSSPCPVLFYIHGGAFAYDSAVMFNETQIVEKYASDGVIFLIPAFRLGVFGFLDLGSDDIVPRNLGLHDIIFALKWTRRDVRAFGGDPSRITIMGNSAGGSAVEYLLVSPGVSKDDFRQAIISSAVPYFAQNLNMLQSLAIMEHFNCLNDFRNNRSSTDRQKVECLRNISAVELIAAQRYLEETRDLAFVGPETDTLLLPADSYAKLMPRFKPHQLLISTTESEMRRLDGDLDTECLKAEIPLGYRSSAVHEACLRRYNSTFNSSDPKISASFMVGTANQKKGGRTYMLSFRQANHTGHADDLLFFFGLHWMPNISWTAADKLMDLYYPSMIKHFLRNGVPDRDWEPMNARGENFFVVDYKVDANGSTVEWPHPVNGQVDDPSGIKFWTSDAASFESGRLPGDFDGKNSEPATDRKNGEGKTHRKPKHWWDKNTDDNEWAKESNQWWKRRDRFHFGNHLVVNSTNAAELITSLNQSDSTMTTAATIPGNNTNGSSTETAILLHHAEHADEEYAVVSEIWSAYFLTLTVAVLLSIVIVMLVASRIHYRFKSQTLNEGYSYSYKQGAIAKGAEREQHPSEATRILVKGNTKYM